MKRLLLALFLSLATTAYAGDFTFVACTLDHQEVTTVLDLVNMTGHPVVEHVATAYAKAASQLSADQFMTSDGFYALTANLDETDLAAINGVSQQPAVTGTCQQ